MASIVKKKESPASKMSKSAKKSDSMLIVAKETLQLHKKRDSLVEDSVMRKSVASTINNDMSHLMDQKPTTNTMNIGKNVREEPLAVIKELKNITA